MNLFKHKRLLVILDYAQTKQPALEQAIELAAKSGSMLDIITVVYDKAFEISHKMGSDSEHLDKLRDNAMVNACDWLKAYLADNVPANIDIEQRCFLSKREFKVIFRCEAAENYDLILKSSENHPQVRRISRKPSDWHLIRFCKAPIFLAKQFVSLENREIVAAVCPVNHSMEKGKRTETVNDHVRLNKVIVDTTTDLNSCFNTRMAVTTAYPSAEGSAIDLGSSDSHREFLEKIKTAHQGLLDQFCDIHNIPKEQSYMRKGAVDEVVDQIREETNAALIVIGTHAREGLEAIMIGNSAETILERSTGNILVVKGE